VKDQFQELFGFSHVHKIELWIVNEFKM
jgi:hypothetical protein